MGQGLNQVYGYFRASGQNLSHLPREARVAAGLFLTPGKGGCVRTAEWPAPERQDGGLLPSSTHRSCSLATTSLTRKVTRAWSAAGGEGRAALMEALAAVSGQFRELPEHMCLSSVHSESSQYFCQVLLLCKANGFNSNCFYIRKVYFIFQNL